MSDEHERRDEHAKLEPMPFDEFREHGLLWLVNRVVFHPRGYALAFHFEDDGTVSGWSMLGDGTEPWRFADDPDSDQPTEDELFARVAAFLASLPAGN